MRKWTKVVFAYTVVVSCLNIIGCSVGQSNVDEPIRVEDSCSERNHPADSLSPVSEITKAEMFNAFSERAKNFQDALNLNLFINKVENDSVTPNTNKRVTYFDVKISFVNTTNSPVVIRFPQTIGFSNDPSISEGAIYDLTLRLKTKNGAPIGGLNKFEILDERKIKLEDFFLVKGRESLCADFKLKLPQVFINNVGHDFLPSGEYSVSAEYDNYMVGYEIPLTESAPSNLSFTEDRNWTLSHQTILDINAWVGDVTSQEVNFVLDK